MKVRKMLCVFLSALLFFNLVHIGSTGTAAFAEENGLTLKSVSVDTKFVQLGGSNKLTVDASTTATVGLADEAAALYVMNTGTETKEIEVSLPLVAGKYEASVAIQDATYSGDWKLSYIIINDKDNNSQVYYNSVVNPGVGKDLSSADFKAGDDVAAPSFQTVAVERHTILPGGSGLKVSVKANDDLSGLASEANLLYVSGDKEKEVALTLKNGVYEGELKLDNTYPAGTYQISFITINDNGGNVKVIYNSKVHGSEIGQDLSAGDVTTDLTAPNSPQINLSTEQPTNKDVAVTIVTDETNAKIEYKLNENLEWQLYTGAFNVAQNTKIYARVTDEAGNIGATGIKEIKNIDKQAPVITIKGVEDKAIYNKTVKPEVTVDDSEATIIKLLNGKPYNGEDISNEGSYTFTVSAIDKVGNVAQVVKTFVIDKTAPALELAGVTNNGLYNITVKPKVITEKDNVVTQTLNDKPYNGEDISAEGSYTLKVTAVDPAGNKSETSIVFVIDKTAPVISVSGVEAGKDYVNDSVSPTIKIDDSAATLSVKLDNEVIALSKEGTTKISAVGKHTLEIKAVDKAGNVVEKTIKFSISCKVAKDGKTTAAIIDEAIKNTKGSATLAVEATSNPVIPKEVLSSLKGTDKAVTFEVESQGITLQWTINGKDILDTTKEVDLSLNASAENKAAIDKIDSNAQILSFKTHGVLPAPLTVRIPVDPNKVDVSKPIYFYYYDPSTKKVELIGEKLSAYKIGNEYFVDVTIKHFSDYFLTNKDAQVVNTLVKTGSMLDLNFLVTVGILIAGLGALLLLGSKRRITEK